MATLLITKLLNGCNLFMEIYGQIQLEKSASMALREDPAKVKKKASSLPFNAYELRKKLKEMRSIIGEEQNSAGEVCESVTVEA